MSGGVAPERSGPFLLAKVTRELAGQWGSVKRPLLKHSFQRKKILVGLPFYCWKLCSRISVRFWWRWLDLEARRSGSWCYSTHGMQHTTLKTICPVSRCFLSGKKTIKIRSSTAFYPHDLLPEYMVKCEIDHCPLSCLGHVLINVCFSLSYQSWHVMQITCPKVWSFLDILTFIYISSVRFSFTWLYPQTSMPLEKLGVDSHISRSLCAPK